MGCKLRVPARGYLFYWYSHRHDVVRAVGMLLWPWQGADKRDEFESVMRLADGHWLEPLAPVAVSSMEELAWAAGLFDGEGSVTTSRSARSRTIEACLPQSAAAGIPNVLERFQRAVARGRIYGPRKRSDPWSKLPQYRWRSTNITDVCTTIEMLWPWLCEAKRSQTVNALERYATSSSTVTICGSRRAAIAFRQWRAPRLLVLWQGGGVAQRHSGPYAMSWPALGRVLPDRSRQPRRTAADYRSSSQSCRSIPRGGSRPERAHDEAGRDLRVEIGRLLWQ